MITLYRCSVCGTWSHANRKPKFHRAFVRNDDGELAERIPRPYGPDDLIEFVDASSYPYEGDDPGGWRFRCGPFDTYEARKVA